MPLDYDKEYVFVYGSLKKGYGNHELIADQEFLGNATSVNADFLMVSLGQFPAVCPRPNSFKVEGELYKVDRMGLALLDRLESNGSLYNRRKVPFKLDNGTEVSAWIYLMDAFYAARLRSVGPGFSAVKERNNTLIWE